MFFFFACHSPLPDTITLVPVEAAPETPGREPPNTGPSISPIHDERVRPWADALAMTDTTGICGDPSNPDALLTVVGDCRAWIGVTQSRAVYEGNPTLIRLNPPVGQVFALAARRDQVIVGGVEGVARREWTPGRPSPDQWAMVPRPAAMTSVHLVDALATSFRADLWFSDHTTLCHSDGGQPSCVPMKGARAIAAIPQGAWVVDEDGRLWLVPAGGGALDRSALASPSQELLAEALLFDTARGVVWVATPTTLRALDPATGAQRQTWPWSPGRVDALTLDPRGLRVFGDEEQFAQFGF